MRGQGPPRTIVVRQGLRRYDCAVEVVSEGGAAQARELTVYTGADCHLCEVAHEKLDRIAPELGLAVRYVTIDGNPELERSYRLQIPVGFLAGRKVFKYRVDDARLRRVAAHLPAPTS